MHLLRCLVFYAAFFGFQFMAKHVPGVLNTAADEISRLTFSLSVSTGTTCGHTTAIAGAACAEETQLGLRRLDSTVQALISQGVAESTRAVYQSGWRHYSRFCSKYSLSLLPLNEHIICQFAAELSESVSCGTIRSYLSGLRSLLVFLTLH